MPFAEGTEVPFERSRDEIERTLKKYGAHSFAYGWQGTDAVIAFEAHDRRIRLELRMPTAIEFKYDGRNRIRTETQREEACAAEMRRRWRCLALVIKAKLEAVQSRITEFESEFLAHIILPNGETAGQWFAPQLAQAYSDKRMPPLLGAAKP